jgi:hypothetical protein
MDHPAVVETGAVKPAITQNSRPEHPLHRKLRKSWRAGCCWLRYLSVGRRRGLPGLVEFLVGNHFFSPMQVREELEALGKLIAALKPRRALEIGTARGGTLLMLARLAHPQATLISVDLPGGPFGGGYSARRAWVYRRFARRGQRIWTLRADSHDPATLEQVQEILAGQPLDYLFIDGDHRYQGVKQDFKMYGPLVRKGGADCIA